VIDLTSPITIRRLTAADEDALRRLAELDSSRVPEGKLVGAELGGNLVLATSPATGETVTDPFVRTKELRAMMELLLRQLGRRERDRSRALWFEKAQRVRRPADSLA
jgi:hypothetical protein